MTDRGSTPSRYILTLVCPDRPGIVHAVCSGLLEVGGNIVENAQFGDAETNQFCMRTLFDAELDGSADSAAKVAEAVLAHLGDPSVELRVRPATTRPRVLIMVSRYDHCLVDLLYRWRTGKLAVDVPAIVSNHTDCAELAAQHGLRFVHLPVTPGTKPAQEAALLDLVDQLDVDLVVLARYMQILSDGLCEALRGRAINIHHSFLPGFKGAKPYHQAHVRGVKLVGATAHFVTADLDEGPIIEQDVARVNHAHTVGQLTSLGQDIERMVLARAVHYFTEDRVLLVGNRTVVFP
jgi:formyltetrahydrofolate deformylase